MDQTLLARADGFLRSAWKASLIIGILAAILGILIVARPVVSIVVAAILFGVYLLFSGIAQLFFALVSPAHIGSRIVAIIAGILSIILAFLCFRDADSSIIILATWIGVGWILEGISRLTLAGAPGVPTGMTVFSGIISVLGGLVLIFAPGSSLTVLVVIAGVLLIVFGVTHIITSLQWRRSIRRSRAA